MIFFLPLRYRQERYKELRTPTSTALYIFLVGNDLGEVILLASPRSCPQSGNNRFADQVGEKVVPPRQLLRRSTPREKGFTSNRNWMIRGQSESFILGSTASVLPKELEQNPTTEMVSLANYKGHLSWDQISCPMFLLPIPHFYDSPRKVAR